MHIYVICLIFLLIGVQIKFKWFNYVYEKVIGKYFETNRMLWDILSV